MPHLLADPCVQVSKARAPDALRAFFRPFGGGARSGMRPGGPDGRGRIAPHARRRRQRETPNRATRPSTRGGAARQRELAPVALAAPVAAPGHAAARARGERGGVVPAHALEGRAARARLLRRPAGAARAPAAGEAHPPRVVDADHLERRPADAPSPLGLVVGVGEHAVAHAAAEVGGVRAVGEVGDRRAARASARSAIRSARRRCAGRRPPRPAAPARRRAPARAPSRPRGGRC